MAQPALHGRDHCPGGADPIPEACLSPASVLDSAYLFFDGDTIANDSTTNINFVDGIDGTTILADFTDDNAFTISQTGIYLLQGITVWSDTFAGGKMARIAWVVGNAIQDTNYTQQWVSEQDTGTNVDLVSVEALVFVNTIGAGDNKFTMAVRQNSGAPQDLSSVDFSIVRLSSYS